MKNIGNVNGVVFTSDPPQWDEVWICEKCKVKRTVRVCSNKWAYPEVSDYKELKDSTNE